jgi:seryl-tRNA synthetase
MINLKLLKQDKEKIKKLILSKDPSFNIDRLIDLHEAYIASLKDISELQEKINTLSDYKNQSQSRETIKEEVKRIKEILIEKTKAHELHEKNFFDYAYTCPNIPMESLPEGGKEHNFVERYAGEKPTFSFSPKNHVSLLTKNNEKIFNFGSGVAKSGFFAYESQIAWLIYRIALICLKHNEKEGFSVIHVPQVANTETITCAGNLPRFKDELFFINGEDLALIPTAEVILSSYCKESQIEIKDLPVRLTAWTKCYRKEAGGYGANERGLIRIHEFEKIEIFSFTSEETSEAEQKKMIATVEKLLNRFGLHYQVVLLARQDCSFSSAKTYDIELWLPGQNQYKEVSSISNCTDFQSRRSKSKYKDGKKSTLLHTLNGSSIALPRLLVALLETWQEESGQINFKGLCDLIKKIEYDLDL